MKYYAAKMTWPKTYGEPCKYNKTLSICTSKGHQKSTDLLRQQLHQRKLQREKGLLHEEKKTKDGGKIKQTNPNKAEKIEKVSIV